ncbi:MAG: cytochrome c [Bacteroidetes bacterium]|nr:cytochrome c [Bacteroidota bacterium]
MKTFFSGCILAFLGMAFLNACQQNPYKHGEILYEGFCASCHMSDGTGLIGNIPPLKGSDFLINHKDQVACIIRYGIADTLVVNGSTYSQPMAGIPQLSDIEIANIINYINHAWENDYGFYPPAEVKTSLENCQTKGK